jgi:hypothetical protein
VSAADLPPPHPPARSSIEEASEKLAAFLKHAQTLRDVAGKNPRADDESSHRSDLSDRSLTITTHPRVPRWAWLAIAGLSLLAIVEGAYIAGLGPIGSRGTLRVFSEPSSAEVRVDGFTRGRTPIVFKLPPGTHTLELLHGATRRTLQVDVPRGGLASYFLELPQRTIDARALDAVVDVDRTVDGPNPPAPPVASSTGTIEVRSTPPGAVVVFAGRRRGVTPIKLPDVAPGVHDVEIGGRAGSVLRRVSIVAGRTAVLDIPYESARP